MLILQWLGVQAINLIVNNRVEVMFTIWRF